MVFLQKGLYVEFCQMSHSSSSYNSPQHNALLSSNIWQLYVPVPSMHGCCRELFDEYTWHAHWTRGNTSCWCLLNLLPLWLSPASIWTRHHSLRGFLPRSGTLGAQWIWKSSRLWSQCRPSNLSIWQPQVTFVPRRLSLRPCDHKLFFLRFITWRQHVIHWSCRYLSYC